MIWGVVQGGVRGLGFGESSIGRGELKDAVIKDASVAQSARADYLFLGVS